MTHVFYRHRKAILPKRRKNVKWTEAATLRSYIVAKGIKEGNGRQTLFVGERRDWLVLDFNVRLVLGQPKAEVRTTLSACVRSLVRLWVHIAQDRTAYQ